MSYIVSTHEMPRGPAFPDASDRQPREGHLRLSNRITARWQWPSRCFRLLPSRESAGRSGPRWLLVDGYDLPRLRGSNDFAAARHREHEQERSGEISLIDEEAWRDTRIACYTAVVIGIDAPILTLERDRLGARTAYYRSDDRRTLISTSSHAVAVASGRPVEENPDFIGHLFAWLRPAPLTSAFRGVQQAPPGRRLHFFPNGIESEPLEAARADDASFRSPRASADSLGKALERAVADATFDAHPAAVMLSGGIDSNAVAAACATSDDERRPIAVSWRLPRYPIADESDWIREAASWYRMRLVSFDASPLLPFSALGPSQVDSDLPVYNPFRRAILECYRLASEHGARIVLNGAAGDQIYPGPASRLLDQLRRLDLTEIAVTLGQVRKRHGLLGAHRSPELRYIAARLARPFRQRPRPRIPAWITPGAETHLASASEDRPVGPDHEYRARLVRIGSNTALENGFSRRYGLDRRDPYASPEIVSAALRIPRTHHFRRGADKWTMREAMRERLPESIRTKKRTGLLHAWFDAGFEANRETIREILMDGPADWRNWVRREYVGGALNGETHDPRARIVVGACLGYTLWRMRIEQGGVRADRGCAASG